MACVALESLSKVFKGSPKGDVHAVKEVTLTVEDKELLVLVGPSGCGKTTLLRMIAGLEEISAGTVSINGKVANKIPPQDRDIAMVFQNYALYPHMTAVENMAFGLKLRKLPRADIEQRVREATQILGLNGCLDRLPNALSGGERQRVALARALVQKPTVFLFDEPLSNLDAPMRAQMRREISKLHARLAATMIYVTHDQVEAMALGDRIAVMNQGTIQQVADPMTLYHSPENLFVAGFIGSPAMNIVRGTFAVEGAALVFQELPGQKLTKTSQVKMRLDDEMAGPFKQWVGKPMMLGIRPEDVLVRPFTSSLISEEASGRMEALVELVEPLGPETYLYLNAGAQSLAARVPSNFRPAVNAKVSVVFDARKAHFFDPGTGQAIG
jgi:multiple sugar transport system ATP-binding protein